MCRLCSGEDVQRFDHMSGHDQSKQSGTRLFGCLIAGGLCSGALLRGGALDLLDALLASHSSWFHFVFIDRAYWPQLLSFPGSDSWECNVLPLDSGSGEIGESPCAGVSEKGKTGSV